MLWRALARLGTDTDRQSALLAAGGAALFVLSDSLIGINRFLSPFSGASYLILLSYRLGRFGIAASAVARSTLDTLPKNRQRPLRKSAIAIRRTLK